MIKQNARIVKKYETVGTYPTVNHYTGESPIFLHVVPNYRKATFSIENDAASILSGSKDQKCR